MGRMERDRRRADLWQSYWTNNGEAQRHAIRNSLVIEYSPIAWSVARSFAAQKTSTVACVEDLYQIGVLGMMRAIEKYRDGRGATFETFARHCIRNRIVAALRGPSWRMRMKRAGTEMFSIEDDWTQRPSKQAEANDDDWWLRITRGLQYKQRLVVILTNGETGTARRIEPMSFKEWLDKSVNRAEQREVDDIDPLEIDARRAAIDAERRRRNGRM